MNFEVIVENLPKLLDGALLTVELVVFSSLAGLALAFPLALARCSPRLWLRAGPWAYIFFFRGTPLLVQLFLVYYGLSQFEAVRASVFWPILRDAWWCALITMALHTAAYIAEILRGAIQAVPRGEIEAAHSLGMGVWQAQRRIVLPRAVRIALPAYSNEVILMLKGSALASTITLLELTGAARTVIARTYMPIEIFLAAGVLYLLISFALVQVFRLLERRLGVFAC
ncbi:MAG: ABC transporter permease [Alphaproteobacteria bacterium]|nr:ABC transporter permease [Alphaproteobacteria bacterium]